MNLPKINKMERISYNGTIQIITDAIQDAVFILENETFHEALIAKTSFENSNASGKIISGLIKDSNIQAIVETYKPFPIPPWSRANAYTKPSEPNKIFLNRRKLNRSIESIAATIVHEYVHLIDYANSDYEFGHGDNSSVNKENTAPYWIDILAYEILTGEKGKVVFQHGEEHE